MHTHLLIDLDGTISDSSDGIGRSLRHAFTTCGYDAPSDDQIRAAIGPPFEHTFPDLGVPAHDTDRVITAYRDRYEHVGLFENRLYDGVATMLQQLAEGRTLAVATAKPETTAVRIIEHFGLADHFAVQAGASETMHGDRRTKAEVIDDALDRLGITGGEHVLMIGDRDHDVHGAVAHGIDCLGVTWGFGSPEELRDAGAIALVDHPADVAAAVSAAYRPR